MKNPKLSIVLPIYNKESFIRECLQSLVLQNVSYEDYEIICVNDGSTDCSQLIINEFVNKHSNIIPIQKKNGGVSSARNVGIENASGDYIWFVDPDDYISENCLADVLELLRNDYDRIRLGFAWVKLEKNDEKFSFADGAVWGSIFSKTIINKNNIRFDENISHTEDTLFFLNYIIHENNVTELNKLCYYYRINEQSVTYHKSPDSHERKTKSYILSAIQIKKLIDNYDISYCCSKSFLVTHFLFVLRPALESIANYSFFKVIKCLKMLNKGNAFPFKIPEYYTHTLQEDMQKFGKKKSVSYLCCKSNTRIGFFVLYMYYLPDRVKNYAKKILYKIKN